MKQPKHKSVRLPATKRRSPDKLALGSNGIGLRLPGKLTPTGWQLPENLSEGDWVKYGRWLNRTKATLQWLIGDWWVFGDRRYGEGEQLAERIGANYGTLCNYGTVARAYDFSLRNENLTFEHHRAAMAAPPEERLFWLKRAEQNKWSNAQLREAIARQQTQPIAFDDRQTLPSPQCIPLEVTEVEPEECIPLEPTEVEPETKHILAEPTEVETRYSIPQPPSRVPNEPKISVSVVEPPEDSDPKPPPSKVSLALRDLILTVDPEEFIDLLKTERSHERDTVVEKLRRILDGVLGPVTTAASTATPDDDGIPDFLRRSAQ